MIIGGVAPIVAPLLGGVLLGPIGWRGIFWVLAAVAVVMTIGVLSFVPESLPPEKRHGGGLSALARNFGYVARNRRFVGYAATFALGFGAMFAYISRRRSSRRISWVCRPASSRWSSRSTRSDWSAPTSSIHD